MSARWRHVDFEQIAGVDCPCGSARRAFVDEPTVPFTVHVTEISRDARAHYHKTLTETYFFLKCDPDAQMELDGRKIAVAERQAILIPPGVRHRAVGAMTVLIIAHPKFDPADEWFDDD